MSSKETSDKSKLTFKRSTLVGAAALAISASPAYALTLGEAEISSGLNQKFLAEIDLGAITSDELNGLSVRVAPDADYRRANMETGGVESSFSFEIVGQGNDAVVRVTSNRLISEPLVVFLLEARWQRGRLLREYAIFLDPVDPNQEQQFAPRVAEPEVEPAPLPVPVVEAAKQAPTADELERQRLRAPVYKPLHSDALPELPYHYGPVQKGVTGIQVATELAQGTVLTPEQMLMALFEVNPVAFHGNVNGLDAGFMLRIPDAIDIAEINSAVAAEEIARHNAAWRRHVANGGNNKVVVAPLSAEETEEERRLAAAADEDSADVDDAGNDAIDESVGEDAVVDEVADNDQADSEEQESQSVRDVDSVEEDRLELVAPDSEDVSTETAEVSTSSNPEVAEAQAEAAALRVENERLREQLSETESLLLDIRALLVARSDELSELKTRIAKLEGRAVEDEDEELEIITSSVSDSGVDDTGSSASASDAGSETSTDGGAQEASPEEDAQNNQSATAATATPDRSNDRSVASDDQGSEGDLLSTVSKTFDGVVNTVISIGWLILLPLLLLLLIILLFLLRRRKKDDENEEVTASSVDEVEDADADESKPESIYGARGMVVTTGSVDDYGDDFVDELGDDDDELSPAQETEEEDFGDFDDELGEDLDDDGLDAFASDDLLEDEDEEIGEVSLDELEDSAEDELDDGFDILLPPSDSDDVEDTDSEVAEVSLDELDVSDEEQPTLEQETSEPADEMAGDDHDDLLAFDETAYQAPAEEVAPPEMDATEDDLDFDLGDFEISEPEPEVDVAAGMPSVDVDDDFGLNDDPLGGLDDDSAATAVPEADDSLEIPVAEDDASSLDDLIIDSGSADESLDVADDSFDIAMEEPAPEADPMDALAADLDEPEAQDTVADAPSDDADADIAAFAGGDQSNTKLDLAKAYIEMGDTDEAKSLLEEVIAETDGAIKAEAEAALAELG